MGTKFSGIYLWYNIVYLSSNISMLGNICWNALSCVLHNWSDGINLPLSGKQQGPNTKMVFLVIRIHYEYKIVMRPSYLYKGNHYTARQHLYIERAPRETTRVCPNIKTVFPVIRMSIMKIIWLWDHLIFIGGIPPLVREYLYIERAPDCQHLYHFYHGVFSCCIETWKKNGWHLQITFSNAFCCLKIVFLF